MEWFKKSFSPLGKILLISLVIVGSIILLWRSEGNLNEFIIGLGIWFGFIVVLVVIGLIVEGVGRSVEKTGMKWGEKRFNLSVLAIVLISAAVLLVLTYVFNWPFNAFLSLFAQIMLLVIAGLVVEYKFRNKRVSWAKKFRWTMSIIIAFWILIALFMTIRLLLSH